jgi:hypothetical protein
MSVNHRRRLEALERRQIRGLSWQDPFPSIERLWPELEAVSTGNACWIPRPEHAEPWSEETKDTFDRLVAEFDRMAERLMVERKAG